MTSLRVLEVDIGEAILAEYRDPCYAIRRCVPLIHPVENLIEVDAIVRKTLDDHEQHFILEFKRRLNAELESDITRWIGWAPWLIIGYEPAKNERGEDSRVDRLNALGIGRTAVVHGKPFVRRRPLSQRVDPVLAGVLAKAFDSHDGSMDPPAGSAAANRMTPARTQWEPVRTYLAPRGEAGSIWSWIKIDVMEMRRFTCAQARKAVDRGEMLGVDYRVKGGQTVFFTKEAGNGRNARG